MPCRAWRFKGRDGFLNWVLGQRFMPPIAIIMPLVTMYKVAGMRDTDNLFLGYVGLMMIYALMNLPIAVLLMKSFFDDVPKDVDEAAMIDGATRWQTFRKVVLPMVRGGVAAAAVLCFIFSWTEFLLSLFLTTDHSHGAGQDHDFRHLDGLGMGLHLGARHGCHRARASSSFCSSNAIWSAASLLDP